LSGNRGSKYIGDVGLLGFTDIADIIGDIPPTAAIEPALAFYNSYFSLFSFPKISINRLVYNVKVLNHRKFISSTLQSLLFFLAYGFVSSFGPNTQTLLIVVT
jgi:hypothetical protein